MRFYFSSPPLAGHRKFSFYLALTHPRKVAAGLDLIAKVYLRCMKFQRKHWVATLLRHSPQQFISTSRTKACHRQWGPFERPKTSTRYKLLPATEKLLVSSRILLSAASLSLAATLLQPDNEISYFSLRQPISQNPRPALLQIHSFNTMQGPLKPATYH